MPLLPLLLLSPLLPQAREKRHLGVGVGRIPGLLLLMPSSEGREGGK